MSVVDVFGAGIPLSTNFALQSNLPVDARLVVANEDSLAQFNKNNLYCWCYSICSRNRSTL